MLTLCCLVQMNEIHLELSSPVNPRTLLIKKHWNEIIMYLSDKIKGYKYNND
jgi:hypothetical protein